MNAFATIIPAQSDHAENAENAENAERPVERRGPGRPSDVQYMRALERANEVRIARAELKRRVASGETDAGETVLNCPWEAASMAVGDLLVSQRRWGKTRTRKLLAQVPLSERKTIGSMTDRQRRTLVSLLTRSRCEPSARAAR